MRFNLILISLSVFFLTRIYSQNMPVSAGGDASSVDGQISFSIGQTFYHQYSGVNGDIVEEGMQHEFGLTTIIEDIDDINVDIFPNPASEFLLLNFDSIPQQEITCQTVNSLGQVTGIYQLNQKTNQIDIHNYTPGVYYLMIWIDDKLTKQLKFIII
ncbi:MAG: hypothetical protein Kow0068_14930 [Marinilabiliales bacterium]